MLAFSNSPPPPEEKVRNKSGNESYIALVWRRLKRSWTGMGGLTLVILLLMMAVFAEFVAPLDPKATDTGFAPPQVISFHDKDGNLVFQPRVYALVETSDLDPVTFQPIVGPDYDNPRLLGFSSRARPIISSALSPAIATFSARPTADRFISSAPTNSAGMCCRAPFMARASR